MIKAIINIKSNKKVKTNADAYVFQMTPELEKLIGRVRKDFKNNKNISGPFSTAEEIDTYLSEL